MPLVQKKCRVLHGKFRVFNAVQGSRAAKLYARFKTCCFIAFFSLSSDAMKVLEVKNVTFAYQNSPSPAVDDASFSLEENSYTVLAGVNGSGKSTLSRIVAGLLQENSGSVYIKDGFRIGIVFQSPKDQIICSVVSRDTAFAPKNQGLSEAETELRTIESLTATGMMDFASHRSMSLSLGQTQKVALSGILSMNPDILVLDESVAMLDPVSRRDIFNFLDAFHKMGRTILHVTHDRDALMRSCDVIVMDGGKILWHGSRESFLNGEGSRFCKKVFGPSLRDAFSALDENSMKESGRKSSVDEVVLAVKNLAFSYSSYGRKNVDSCRRKGRVHSENVGANESSLGKTRPLINDASFVLKKGSLTAITGPSGSGKSTLLEILAGLLFAGDGDSVHSKNRPLLCQQNSDSALFETFASDDVAFGPSNHGKSGAELVSSVKEAMKKVGLPFEDFGFRQTAFLSGGEKRRLALAGIIAMDSEVLLFDEPTAGLDGPARIKIIRLMRELCAEGRTILFSSHHPDEVDFADEHLHLEDGNLEGSCVCSGEDVLKMIEDSENLTVQSPMEASSILRGFQDFSGGDFMKHSGFGEKKSGPLERLPSALKVFIFAVLFSFSLAVRPLWLCGTLVVLSLFYALLSRSRAKKLFSAMAKIVPLLIFFCAVQFAFGPVFEGDRVFVSYRFFSVSVGKLVLCARVLLHTEAALCCVAGFLSSTDEDDIVRAVEAFLYPLKILGVPVRFAVVLVEVMFRFVPLLLEEAVCIIKTQLVRGALGKSRGIFGKVRAVLPLIVPLVIQTVKRAEKLADALTARGF